MADDPSPREPSPSWKPAWIRRERLLDFLYLFSDTFAVVLSYVLSFDRRLGATWIRRFLDSSLPVEVNELSDYLWGGTVYAWYRLAVLALVIVAYIAAYDYLYMYHGYRRLTRPNHRWQVICVNLSFMGIAFMVAFLLRDTSLPRAHIPIFCFANTVLTLGFRSILRRLLRFVRRHVRRLDSPVIVIGKTPHARDICRIIRRRRPHGMYVSEHVDSRILRDIESLRALVVERKARAIFVADTQLSLDSVMNAIELTAELHNVSCTVVTNRLNVLPMKAGIPCSMVRGVPCIYFDALHSVFKGIWPRRVFSRLVAAAAILALSPLLLAVAAVVRATSPGPALFLQKRYGIDRKTFTIFKFRTMYMDAEARLASLESQNKMGRGGLFKIEHDPRVTPVGRFLRRTSIDELPQLFNVVRGDMRIVGPRPLPERDFQNYFREWHYGRHMAYPGLTCLWQISGRSDIDFQTMCILDHYYVRNNNWCLDLSIVFRTVAVIFNGRGAY